MSDQNTEGLLKLVENWNDPNPKPVLEKHGKVWVARLPFIKCFRLFVEFANTDSKANLLLGKCFVGGFNLFPVICQSINIVSKCEVHLRHCNNFIVFRYNSSLFILFRRV